MMKLISIGALFVLAPLLQVYGAFILSSMALATAIEFKSPNEVLGGHFGGDVSGVPDTNGDGVGDLIVAAGGEPTGPNPPGVRGRAYIIDGSTFAILRTLISPNTSFNEWRVSGFATSVSGIPDVNGDGRGDIVVGSIAEGPGDQYSGSGRAYIFDGFTGVPLHTLVSPNEEAEGRFGFSVSGTQDLNGDGRGDVIVGADNENGDRGRAYVFDGASGAYLYALEGQGGGPRSFGGRDSRH